MLKKKGTQNPEHKPEKKKSDPNLRELPENVKPLVEKGSMEYIVKGDGPCLLRTTAAHVVGDANEGPKLARDLNTHLADYRGVYEEKIAADFPLTVTVGVKGETKIFENATEYFDWLQDSSKAAFMWRGCTDIIATCNMAHMEVDVIVYEEGLKPELFSFKPDPDFPWKEEDKMKPERPHKMKQGKMTVLNWKNVHYNLIVGPNHMLYELGSLSFQASQQAGSCQAPQQVLEAGGSENQARETGSTRGQELETRAEKVQGVETIEAGISEYPARPMDKCVDSVETMINQDPATHYKCKLELERKEKEILRLKNHIAILEEGTFNINEQYDNEDIQELDSERVLVSTFVKNNGFTRTSPQEQATPDFKCTYCGKAELTDKDMKAHVNTKHTTYFICIKCKKKFMTEPLWKEHTKTAHQTRTELNCDDCQFQANSGLELKKHLNTKKHKAAHGVEVSTLGETFKCKECKEEFSDKWNLMNHCRDTHPDKRRPCRNYQRDECEYPSDEGPKGCWWSHTAEIHSTSQSSKSNTNSNCNICGESFKKNFNLMIHKKDQHIESVPMCRNSKNGQCEFSKCWFRHEQVSQNRKSKGAQDENAPAGLVFQKGPNQMEPPEMVEMQNILKQAMNMIASVNKKMEIILK